MALINLPNSSQWDTTKKSHEQTKEAQEYSNSVISENTEVLVTQEEVGTIGSGKYRWVKKTHTDTPNSLRVVRERIYRNSNPLSSDFGAVSEHKLYIEQVS